MPKHPISLPDALVLLFSAIGNFEEPVLRYIEEHIKVRDLPKKELILKPGEISKDIMFVENGLLRSFYSEDHKEVTNWFMQENRLVISVHSFFTQTPSDEYIQTLEPCRVWQLRYEYYRYLVMHYHSFCHIALRLTEHYYILSEDRLRIMRQKEAEARYRYLLRIHPDILNRAPLGYIASYLGISQETLSRLRAKKF